MAAGDRYVEVTLEEMQSFLKRAFRALRPKRGESRGEVYFDLNLSDDEVIIRVWSSINPRRGTGAGVGEDAIRVTLITKGGKPLMPKGKIVMRTKNWRNALQDRVEELHELYESKADYWKHKRRERDEGISSPRDTLPSVEDAEAEVSRLERDNAEGRPSRRSLPPGPSVKKTKPDTFEGEYRSLPSGGWGIQLCTPGEPGLEGIAKTKGGKRTRVRLVQMVKQWRDRYRNNAECELWTFEDVAKAKREQAGGGGRWAAEELGADPLIAAVAGRFLKASA